MRGTIVKRTSKNDPKKPLYYLVYWIGNKQKWEAGGSNKKVAEQRLLEIITQVNLGAYSKPKNVAFEEYAQEWLQNYAIGTVKESVFRSYRSVIKNHIVPHLGHYPLTMITPRVVQYFLIALVKKPTKRSANVTAKTANNVLVLLKTMLNHAVKWGYLKLNPTVDIKPFRVEQKEMDYLEPSEIKLLLKNADKPFRALFLTAVLTGMRRGEVLGLQWGDIDWNSSRIFVRRSLYWLSNEEMSERKDRKRWKFVSPKTARSRRTIGLTPELRKALEIHRITSPVSDEDLVFCNNKGNPLDPDNMIKREFHAALTRAGLRKIRFHDLRHTYTSLLIAADFNPKFIQSQVGHASIQTTIDRYGHLFKIDYEENGRKIDQLVFAKSNKNLTESADSPKTNQNEDYHKSLSDLT